MSFPITDRRSSYRALVREAGAALLLGSAVALASAATALGAFEDGDGGATCRYFAAAGRLAWQQEGGDWIDAKLSPYGAAPFDALVVDLRTTPQKLRWNLMPLAQAWLDGSVAHGALMLRVVPGVRNGVVNLSSRESADSSQVPVLELQWDDGHTRRLRPTADTFMSCPTTTNLGRRPTMKVGDGESALIQFPPVPDRPGHHLRAVQLQVVSAKQYGQPTTIGAYGPVLPSHAKVEQGEAISHRYPSDAGIERDPDVLFVENFEDSSRWRSFMEDPGTRDTLLRVSRDDDEDFRPIDGHALRVTIPRGKSQALNHHIRFAALPGGEPDEAYFRYQLRLGRGWDPIIDGGKMPGFAGTYNRAGWGMRAADGYNGWSARGAFMLADSVASPGRAMGTYAYTATSDGKSGEVWGWNLGPTGVLAKSRWYAIEQFVKLNSPGRSDGILRVWIDGQLAFNKTDALFRRTADLHIESVWMNVYHGGVSKADRDLTLFIDNLVIARRHIGPGRFAAR